MKKTISILFTLACFVIVLSKNAFPWDNVKTHRDLSKYAADNSILSKDKGNYLRNFGFVKGLDQILIWDNIGLDVRKWLQEGSFLEDEGSYLDAIMGTARYSNHFHNPLPLKQWNEAGLSDLQSGESTVLWAQDSDKQSVSLGGDWSWQTVRLCYYTALTVQNEINKQTFFARTFEGLGYQMHLIEDMSVPSHTRNDAHPLDSLVGINNETGDYYLETWAKKNNTTINYYASSPVFPQVALNVNPNGRLPIAQFIDTDQYDGLNASAGINQGLAEYTNANFFSDDTIFTEDRDINDKHYFPYPRYSTNSYEIYEIDQSLITKRIYLRKKGDGEQVEHFATAGPLFKWLSFDPELQKTEMKLDPTVFKDYTSFLIPRAVGYSAALIDYFFRGNIEISLPTNGVYSKADNSDAAFTSIKLLAQNITPTGEEMGKGSIELVVKYKVAQESPFDSKAVEKSVFRYIVVPEAGGRTSIPKDAPVELSFNLAGDGLSLWATDVYLQVVYHGRLGNEDGSVAVGFKDISEPTPVDVFNNMDKICINGAWHTAGSESAKQEAPFWDIYTHNMRNTYVKISSIDDPQDATSNDYDYKIDDLIAGDYKRSIYILGEYQNSPEDYKFSYSLNTEWYGFDPNDQGTHLPFTDTYQGNVIKNQVDYNVWSQAECAQVGASAPCDISYYPLMYSFRGTKMWGPAGVIFDNPKYPEEASCSWGAL